MLEGRLELLPTNLTEHDTLPNKVILPANFPKPGIPWIKCLYFRLRGWGSGLGGYHFVHV